MIAKSDSAEDPSGIIELRWVPARLLQNQTLTSPSKLNACFVPVLNINSLPTSLLFSMTSEAFNKPTRPPLSLYANLLEPSFSSSSHGTISRAPIVFKQSAWDDLRQEEDSSSKQQLSAGRHQSIYPMN